MELIGNETGQGFAGMVQPFAFTGYQPDETTGLYYAQARRYDAGTGRFVSEDLIRGFTALPSTLNAYNYCISNPLIYVDEDGQFWHIVIGAVVGAVVNVGFTAYDAYQEGGWDAFKSSKTWENIGVSALKGGIEGAATAAFGPAAGGAITAGTEFIVDSVNQKISGEQVTYEKNIENALISGVTAFGIGKGNNVLGKALKGKSKVILQFEMMEKSNGEIMLDWLAKYARSGAADAEDALKLLGSYSGQESIVDTLINRLSFGENALLDLIAGNKATEDYVKD